MPITSLQNPKIKNVLKLRTPKNRKDAGLILIEGERELARAIQSGVMIEEIFFCPQRLGRKEPQLMETRLSSLKACLYEVTEKVWAKIVYGQRPEGVLAVAQRPRATWNDFPEKENPLYIVLETVEKPGNLGAVLRTCDAVGADGVILCAPQTDIFNPNVIRASLGTIFSVPVIQADNEEALAFLRKRSVRLCATVPGARKIYFKENLTGAVALLMGSEMKGLSPFWTDQAEVKMSLPMNGIADSLNVSTAAAVLLYEALRQRTQEGGV